MSAKLRVGIVGATGYVGQRFVSLLANHPWFEITKLAASGRSAGHSYAEAVSGRWQIDAECPEAVKDLLVEEVTPANAVGFAEGLDLCFCAVNLPKQDIIELELALAKAELPLISNNSAHRLTPDVPMMIPEINANHREVLAHQRRRLGTRHGFIACKPNCSIQSFVPALTPLMEYGIEQIFVSTYQAISGAGKTFASWPEMEHNVIPYIGREEEKSEIEPLKIWGQVASGQIELASSPKISAHCYRVAVQEGHTAAITVKFRQKPEREAILAAWRDYRGLPQELGLPTAPEQFLHYMEEQDRPQPRLDAAKDKGMAIWISRLREDAILDYRFTCLSHNTLRGAAGGAVETAELLVALGEIQSK